MLQEFSRKYLSPITDPKITKEATYNTDMVRKQAYEINQYGPSPRPCIFIIILRRSCFSYTNDVKITCKIYSQSFHIQWDKLKKKNIQGIRKRELTGNKRRTTQVKKSGPSKDAMSVFSLVACLGTSLTNSNNILSPGPFRNFR